MAQYSLKFDQIHHSGRVKPELSVTVLSGEQTVFCLSNMRASESKSLEELYAAAQANPKHSYVPWQTLAKPQTVPDKLLYWIRTLSSGYAPELSNAHQERVNNVLANIAMLNQSLAGSPVRVYIINAGTTSPDLRLETIKPEDSIV